MVQMFQVGDITTYIFEDGIVVEFHDTPPFTPAGPVPIPEGETWPSH